MAKKQTEVPGTERPSIDELDEAIGAWLDAKDEHAEARDKVKEARTAATDRMREFADKLDKDQHKNPVYLYADDYREVAVKLSTSSKLVTETIEAAE